ncbi:hypothetical protein [Saccharolobus caldissimus]|uniref:Uncharacterized protein n=1 Tax=Saccharolobus caldissimus TaxID=1702097 RepID=A0AAQ4CS01_9CREN|nr:hypothetical protein [Saccharolobus caldissimus]BDB98582.1 hypothetical protein SACC_15990 [Saccharolobus caldissimus]
MSSYYDVNRLLRRAEKFGKDAINAYNEGYYDAFMQNKPYNLELKPTY